MPPNERFQGSIHHGLREALLDDRLGPLPMLVGRLDAAQMIANARNVAVRQGKIGPDGETDFKCLQSAIVPPEPGKDGAQLKMR